MWQLWAKNAVQWQPYNTHIQNELMLTHQMLLIDKYLGISLTVLANIDISLYKMSLSLEKRKQTAGRCLRSAGDS